MRMLAVAIVVASALVGTAAQAQKERRDVTVVCGEEGRRLRLAGDQLAEFLTKCWAGQEALTRPQCEALARKQTLSGEVLVGFMKKCMGEE
jgi:hypothetical protein